MRSRSATSVGGLVHKRRSKTSSPIATKHQTRLLSHIIRVVSALACQRVLISMVPSVACAISARSELPEAWLNSQAYQKRDWDGAGPRSDWTRTGA